MSLGKVRSYQGERSEIAASLVEATKGQDKTCSDYALFSFLIRGHDSPFQPRTKHPNERRWENFASSVPELWSTGRNLFSESFKRDESRIETLQKAFDENLDFIIEEALKENQARSTELALAE